MESAACYGAVRHQQRTWWVMGVGLLVVVVLKLFLMDLATEALARIIAFLGIGLLLLGVGYVAPVPPPAVRIEQPDRVVL